MQVINNIYYYIVILFCIGFFLFLKKNPKTGFAFFSILLFCIIWRCFSKESSTRYYSFIIFFSIFFSAYAVKDIATAANCINLQKFVVYFLIICLLFFHLDKCFSSFRNNFILDIQNSVKAISTDEQESDILIYEKEFKRFSNIQNVINSHFKMLLLSDFSDDLTSAFVSNNSFLNNLYLLFPNDFISSHVSNKSFSDAGSFLKIEHHFSNRKHTKFISIYKHFPYTPSPDIDIQKQYKSAILKAFIPEFDAFIYQVQNKLVWLIGAPIDNTTEIIYHVHTDQPELLPKDRAKYGYANGGFFVNNGSEQKTIGKYLVIERILPSKYHITQIGVGFRKGNKFIARFFSLTNN